MGNVNGSMQWSGNGPVAGANNGLSVKDGKAVLGNELDDASAPAGLESIREILMNNFYILLKGINDADTMVKLLSNQVRVMNPFENRYCEINAGDITVTNGNNNSPGIGLTTDNPVSSGAIYNLNGQMFFGNSGLDQGMIYNIITKLTSFFDAIATGDPGTGAGQWKLGKEHAAAVALDATKYLSVTVDGVAYKIALVN